MSASAAFYKFAIKDAQGKAVDLTALTSGKVVLIVNMASQCGFSVQNSGLNKLYETYKDKGFVVLGFPTNDFYQEPLEGDACMRNYGVSFPVMEKIHVNGSEEHPLYAYLKREKPGVLGLKRIKWNYEKFLVDRQGNPVSRIGSWITPEMLASQIDSLLSQ